MLRPSGHINLRALSENLRALSECPWSPCAPAPVKQNWRSDIYGSPVSKNNYRYSLISLQNLTDAQLEASAGLCETALLDRSIPDSARRGSRLARSRRLARRPPRKWPADASFPQPRWRDDRVGHARPTKRPTARRTGPPRSEQPGRSTTRRPRLLPEVRGTAVPAPKSCGRDSSPALEFPPPEPCRRSARTPY
jgi:hypothetical protein